MNMWELYSDILAFVRKLRLQYLLHDKPHKTKTPFQPKSKNNPGVTLHDALETTIEKLKVELTSLNLKHVRII